MLDLLANIRWNKRTQKMSCWANYEVNLFIIILHELVINFSLSFFLCI